MSYKDKIKFLLWNLGLRETIPSTIINNIPIKENNEKLVNIKQDKSLYFADNLQQRKSVLLREQVYNNLKIARQYLPESCFFKIYSAFRPQEEQIQLWNQHYKEIKSLYPKLPDSEIIKKVKAVCADPRFGFGGHQTGGAVDISLCDKYGNDYDMSTEYLENNANTPTNALSINNEQKQNRDILKNAMGKAGFKNYPHEWWHFCYGDRMWAAYSKKKECFYGMPTANHSINSHALKISGLDMHR